MKTCLILTLLCCSLPAFALSGGMEKASVHAMRKVPCTEAQPNGNGGILSGLAHSGSGPGISNECVEYELYTGKVSYIIRPHRAILLLLGGDVLIKLAKDELILHTSAAPKDIRCDVLAMTLRSDEEKSGNEGEWEWEGERDPRRYDRPGCYTETGTVIPCDGTAALR